MNYDEVPTLVTYMKEPASNCCMMLDELCDHPPDVSAEVICRICGRYRTWLCHVHAAEAFIFVDCCVLSCDGGPQHSPGAHEIVSVRHMTSV